MKLDSAQWGKANNEIERQRATRDSGFCGAEQQRPAKNEICLIKYLPLVMERQSFLVLCKLVHWQEWPGHLLAALVDMVLLHPWEVTAGVERMREYKYENQLRNIKADDRSFCVHFAAQRGRPLVRYTHSAVVTVVGCVMGIRGRVQWIERKISTKLFAAGWEMLVLFVGFVVSFLYSFFKACTKEMTSQWAWAGAVLFLFFLSLSAHRQVSTSTRHFGGIKGSNERI